MMAIWIEVYTVVDYLTGELKTVHKIQQFKSINTDTILATWLGTFYYESGRWGFNTTGESLLSDPNVK